MHGSPFAELAGPLPAADTMQYCPQAPSFAVALGTAAWQDNGTLSQWPPVLRWPLELADFISAVAGVFGAGKTRSLTFLLAWLALTTHFKIAVVRKENPAGRTITKLLTAFDSTSKWGRGRDYWGGPLWRPWNPLRFWRLVLGPSMDKIFPRVVIRLAASHCS